MTRYTLNRRSFVNTLGMAAGGAAFGLRGPASAMSQPQNKLHLACNQYPWTVFYQRDGRNFDASLDTVPFKRSCTILPASRVSSRVLKSGS